MCYISSTVVATILESDQWCQALQYCSNDEPNAIETPLRKLITKMPGLLIQLKNRIFSQINFQGLRNMHLNGV